MVFQSIKSSKRPLPLKQRTSSLDTRRDFSSNTWRSLLVLLKTREYFVTVDNFSIWRRHVAWAMQDGKDLRSYMTQRYASNMVFMSLLLSTELAILFNSAKVTTDVRTNLRAGNHFTVGFWAGLLIIVSALLTILSLISTFTAWAMVNAVDEVNVHCIFRSSIGQYAAELPGRFIACSIYFFLISFILFFFLLLPLGIWSILLLCCALFLFIHVVATFSAFGRVIMHTGAMGRARIFDPDYEMSLIPHSLHAHLLAKAKANLANNTSITRQYRRQQKPIDRPVDQDELYDFLSGRLSPSSADETTEPYRRRADSTVRFADEEQQQPHHNHHHHHPSQAHARTLTPLSDISSPEPPTPNSVSSNHNSSLDGRSSVLLATNKSHTTGTTLPPRPNALKSQVSNSSMEQWLQGSPTSSSRGDKASPHHETATPKRTRPPTPPPPPPPKEVTYDTMTSPGTRLRGSPTLSGDTLNDHKPLNEQDLTRLIERDLTEDQRFALDYGEMSFDDEDKHAPERTRLLPVDSNGGTATNYHLYHSTLFPSPKHSK